MPRKLNETQSTTLRAVLKFRYVTSDNLATFKNITQNSAYSRLEILTKEGYLGKLHDKSYRLLNKSARYYLTIQGLDYLKQHLDMTLPNQLWIGRRADAKKSADFVDLQVAVHATTNELKAKYGDKARILNATELYSVEDMIRPLPNLYVELSKTKRFFVEIADDQHLFIVKKRIRKYIQHYEDGEWEWDKYPDVVIIRSASATDRTRLRKYIEQQMEDNGLDEEDFSFNVVSSVGRLDKRA